MVGASQTALMRSTMARTALASRTSPATARVRSPSLAAGAVSEVRAAIPEARLIEVAPDLVGLTDLAGIVQCSRQYMRRLMIDGGESFPLPLHDGKTALWRLAKVLRWLRDKKHYRVDEPLLAIAETNVQFNIARETAEMDAGIQQSIHGLVA